MKRLSFFFVLLAMVSGCTESTTDPEPANMQLTAFFLPIPGSSDWTHQDSRPGIHDSLYTITSIGHDARPSIDGLSPVFLFQVSTADSGKIKTFQNEYYVSDSIIVAYGSNASSDSARIVLLKDTLKVGASWRAAETYVTSDGIRAAIDALVDAYYALIHIGEKDYSDVYRITYRPAPTGVTADSAFTLGARHVHYYARGVGRVLELVYSSDSTLVWKNELIQAY